MIVEIDSEIKVLSKENFSGRIHFGIENSKICSLSFSNKPEVCGEAEINYKQILNELSERENELYGSVDVDMVFGKVKGFTYYYAIRGERLQEKLKADICRNVVRVVKKSDTSQQEKA